MKGFSNKRNLVKCMLLKTLGNKFIFRECMCKLEALNLWEYKKKKMKNEKNEKKKNEK